MLLPLVFDCLRQDSDGKAIIVVVSPLIALTEDQVSSYSAKGHFKAAFTDNESDTDKKAQFCQGRSLSNSVIQS